jgi:hypothetical protein
MGGEMVGRMAVVRLQVEAGYGRGGEGVGTE